MPMLSQGSFIQGYFANSFVICVAQRDLGPGRVLKWQLTGETEVEVEADAETEQSFIGRSLSKSLEAVVIHTTY